MPYPPKKTRASSVKFLGDLDRQGTDDPTDSVNHPKHYNTHPSGVECITIVEHLSFNVGNAIKYLWRAGEKGARAEDLGKARFYLIREAERLERFGTWAWPHRVPEYAPLMRVLAADPGSILSRVLVEVTRASHTPVEDLRRAASFVEFEAT